MNHVLVVLRVFVVCIACLNAPDLFAKKRSRVDETVVQIKEDAPENVVALVGPRPEKNVVVFTSSGGGGHISASNAVRDYLQGSYNILIAQVFGDVLRSYDPVRFFSFQFWSGEDLYNYLLTHNWTWIINTVYRMGAWQEQWYHDAIVKALSEFVAAKQASLVISVVPFLNGAILEATQRMRIPFLIVPTELDTTIFIHGMKAPYPKQFRQILAFDDPAMLEKIAPAQIPKDQLVIGGFPIRPSFFVPKDIKKIRKDFGIPEGKPVAMLMMGARGSTSCYKYVRRLLKNPTPFHLVVCIGKAEHLRADIMRLRRPAHLTLTIVGFTERIADLMTVADVLVTKPGTVSFNEAVYIGVPMLLDSTSGDIAWEGFNVRFAQKHGFGDVIDSYKKLNPLVTKYLTDKELNQKVRTNLRSFKKPRFESHLKYLVASLLAESEQYDFSDLVLQVKPS